MPVCVRVTWPSSMHGYGVRKQEGMRPCRWEVMMHLTPYLTGTQGCTNRLVTAGVIVPLHQSATGSLLHTSMQQMLPGRIQ
jgi:hypothetical protein